MNPPASTETYGNYTLLKRLATGGMAEIFLARQLGLEGFENLLVLKRLLPHLAADVEFVKMFIDEARIAARLMHRNIVQIFNLGSQGESYFIAMEYVHGDDLNQVWRFAEQMKQSIPVELVCRIIVDAARGLDYAHKRTYQNGKPLRVVHRDISPQNILVSFQGDVKVADFGIARAADQSTNTRSGVLKGKRSYMSPEQAQGMRVDARSDIFSMAVVLYELLTTTRLFKRPNAMQTLHAVIACEVAPPSTVNSRVPKELDAVVMGALGKNPDSRYPEAAQLADALETWLARQKAKSSNEAVSAFLTQLYRERLAKEGQSQPEPSRSKGLPPKKATSSAAPKKALTRAEVPVPAPREQTASVAPSRERPSLLRRHGKRWWKQLRAHSRALGVGVAVAAAALTLAGGWMSGRGGPELRIDSEPAGAEVAIDGVSTGESTPCELSGLTSGQHTLSLRKGGYREHQAPLHLPPHGVVRLPPVSLQPDKGPKVMLTVRSMPPGAQVLVGGVMRGRTPVTVAVEGQANAPIALELSGYRTVRLTLEVGNEPTQEISMSLEPSAP